MTATSEGASRLTTGIFCGGGLFVETSTEATGMARREQIHIAMRYRYYFSSVVGNPIRSLVPTQIARVSDVCVSCVRVGACIRRLLLKSLRLFLPGLSHLARGSAARSIKAATTSKCARQPDTYRHRRSSVDGRPQRRRPT